MKTANSTEASMKTGKRDLREKDTAKREIRSVKQRMEHLLTEHRLKVRLLRERLKKITRRSKGAAFGRNQKAAGENVHRLQDDEE